MHVCRTQPFCGPHGVLRGVVGGTAPGASAAQMALAVLSPTSGRRQLGWAQAAPALELCRWSLEATGRTWRPGLRTG